MKKNDRMRFQMPVACLLACSLAVSSFAQSAAAPDPATLAMERKIDALEKLLAEVKAELAQRPGASLTVPAPPTPALTPAVAESVVAESDVAARAENDMHTLGPLQFRGYSDFTYGRPIFSTLPGGDLTASSNGFSLGDFDLFTTARIGRHFSMLGEALITTGFSNEYSVEMDRLLLTFSANDYFKISAGKYNTAIGFYSNEFNRARYFQTATGRPILFADEDDGGILPVHSIGLSANGRIPSGALGLHWVAEVANGRASASAAVVAANTIEPVQNFADEGSGKAANFALYARPAALNGFQAGASMYVDKLHPASLGALNQRIYSAYAALVRPHIELIGEGVYLRHEFTATKGQFNTVSTYAQASYLFGNIRPYFRYEYQNIPFADPIFGILGRRNGPSIGIRFDLTDFVALKVQYGRLGVNLGPSANVAQAQIAFAF